MPFLLAVLYVLFAVAIGALIWKQERRKDRNAKILGLDGGRENAGTVAVVVFSAVLSLLPTLIAGDCSVVAVTGQAARNVER